MNSNGLRWVGGRAYRHLDFHATSNHCT